MNPSSLLAQKYHHYLTLLKELVSINSVYSDTEGIKKALSFCKQQFERYLPNHTIYLDNENNLICFNTLFNPTNNALYFSAHIDTVPADKKNWDKKFDPFIPYEDAIEVIGRGVNDCKAGVAYQLLLASLIQDYFHNTTNIVFTISSREEKGGDSVKEVGKQLGRKLPTGPKLYFFTLENNVTVNPPELSINYAERGTVGVEIVANLKTIQQFLNKDSNEWNPTNCVPLIDNSDWEELHQAGGHAGTTSRETNVLYNLLAQEPIANMLVKAGNGKTVSMLPTVIFKSHTNNSNVLHKVIFDLRTFKSISKVSEELKEYPFEYKFIKILDSGYDLKNTFFSDNIYKTMIKLENTNLRLKFEMNPGTTDSGRVYKYASLKIKEHILPITIGPGSRSQRNINPPRLSHGVNETFNKKAGFEAICFITTLVQQLGFLK